jgi:glycosyltransferase involved in cell wall biosynthesis
MAEALRITWLAPDDLGGGVVSVAQACCRRAVSEGHAATLLLALDPRGTHADEFGGFRLQSLGSQPPHTDIPGLLVNWLNKNPQDIILLNSCEQADWAIPYIPQSTHLVCVVHDTAARYFEDVVRYEDAIDAILAVSQTVAERFRDRLRDPSKLHVVLNGTFLPEALVPVPSGARSDDLVFLGGDKPMKGAFDCLALWSVLQKMGFAGRLHWFGELDASFRARIDRAASHERIIVYGRQPRTEIFRTAAHSKIFLMLSRVEAFGMATVECMGMGCLPVAWDIPTGTKEIVTDGNGSFTPLGNFEAMAQAVMRLVSEHALRFEASSQRIRVEFSEEAMWSRYDKVLQNIAASPIASRSFAGQEPPPYRPPLRLFQRLPMGIRSAIRSLVGRWPRIGFALRGFRGR